MSVIINFKICDNSEDCSGIEACPSGAFRWDPARKTIKIDETKCVKCRLCEKSCPVGAIRVATTQKEETEIRKDIESDPRTVSDLFVDRYGAQPIHSGFVIEEKSFDAQIIRSTKPAVVELYRDDTIECMVKSVPVRELFPKMNIKYRKVNDYNGNLSRAFGVNKLPALLFFSKGKMVGKIEGYLPEEKKRQLVTLVKRFLKNISPLESV